MKPTPRPELRRSDLEDSSKELINLQKSAEQRAIPSANLVMYATLILLAPAFEYGFTYLDLHHNWGAHALFYVLLLGLIREYWVRKPKLILEESLIPLVNALKAQQILIAGTSVLAAATLIYTHHTIFIFPIVTYLIGFGFYLHGRFSSKLFRALAYVQIILATASITVLTQDTGIEWLPYFTTVLAGTMFAAVLFRKSA